MQLRAATRFLFLALFLTVGCSRQPLPPLVHIRCEAGSALADKIDLGVFGELRPGLRFSQATAQLGEPHRVWTGANGTVYHLYQLPKANVAVAKEIQVSGSMPRLEWWTVYAYPSTNTFALQELLSRDVLNELEKHPRPCQLVIRAAGDEGVWCKVEADGITEIRWLNAQSKLPPVD